jgi:iron complex transport system ATP-binding protein
MLKTLNLEYMINGKRLIHQLSLQFEPGKMYGIFGPNGSGKTTLLKNLTGIWKPTHGKVLWKGENLLEKPRKEISKIISFVPQNSFIPFDFSVEQFVTLGLYSHSLKNRDKIETAMQLAEVQPFRDRAVNSLSQGERQRVLIARSLTTQADVIVLDEPTANLDLKYKKHLWDLLIKLAASQKTIIVSHHDIGKSKQYFHHVYVLKEGLCVAEGTFDEAMTTTTWQHVFEIEPHHL